MSGFATALENPIDLQVQVQVQERALMANSRIFQQHESHAHHTLDSIVRQAERHSTHNQVDSIDGKHRGRNITQDRKMTETWV